MSSNQRARQVTRNSSSFVSKFSATSSGQWGAWQVASVASSSSSASYFSSFGNQMQIPGRSISTGSIIYTSQDPLEGMQKINAWHFELLLKAGDTCRAYFLYFQLRAEYLVAVFDRLILEDCRYGVIIGRLLVSVGRYDDAFYYYEQVARSIYVDGFGLKIEGDLFYHKRYFSFACRLYELALKKPPLPCNGVLLEAVFRIYWHVSKNKALAYFEKLKDRQPWGGSVVKLAEDLRNKCGLYAALYVVSAAQWNSTHDCLDRYLWFIKIGRPSLGRDFLDSVFASFLEAQGSELIKDLEVKFKLIIMAGRRGVYKALLQRACGGDENHPALMRLTSGSLSWPRITDFMSVHSLLPGQGHDTLLSYVHISLNYFSKNEGDRNYTPLVSCALLLKNMDRVIKGLDNRGSVFITSMLTFARTVAQRDPRFVICLFSEDERLMGWKVPERVLLGVSYGEYRKIGIAIGPNSVGFASTFIHELVHLLMSLLFDNNALPWPKGNAAMEQEFRGAMNSLQEKVAMAHQGVHSGPYRAVCIGINDVRIGYAQEQHPAEYIARYGEYITLGFTDDKEVRILLKPFEDYWNTHITPRLANYLASA